MYTYDAVHNTIKHVEDDDTFDERGVLKAGKHVRVPMMAMDSMQRSIAADSGTVDSDSDRSREAYDYAKAELGAAYKNGHQTGDTFRLGDKMVVVQGRNPENGKLQLRDASSSTTDAETRQAAHDSYDAEIQTRYLNNTYDAKAGESCLTAGREKGVWREKNGRLICVVGGKPEDKEWAHAGPLSDAARAQIKDEMYQNYDLDVSERWKR